MYHNGVVPVRLSVLDQSPVPQGQTIGDALRNTIDLARLTDQLGYERYWLAEHHGAASLACASPEVLIGPVAAATRHLRVGSGGVMLPHYSALKVAESFSMLAGLYPNRIDLGIGRAAGTSARIAHALQRDKRQPPPDDFPQQLAELMEYFSNQHPLLPGHFVLKSGCWVLPGKARNGRVNGAFLTRLRISSIRKARRALRTIATASRLRRRIHSPERRWP